MKTPRHARAHTQTQTQATTHTHTHTHTDTPALCSRSPLPPPNPNQDPPIVHRDLKSLNICLDEAWVPKVCDFGISRSQSLSTTMTRVGTPQARRSSFVTTNHVY